MAVVVVVVVVLVVAVAPVNDELGLGISALAAKALDSLHNVLGGLVGDLPEDHVAAIQPVKQN